MSSSLKDCGNADRLGIGPQTISAGPRQLPQQDISSSAQPLNYQYNPDPRFQSGLLPRTQPGMYNDNKLFPAKLSVETDHADLTGTLRRSTAHLPLDLGVVQPVVCAMLCFFTSECCRLTATA